MRRAREDDAVGGGGRALPTDIHVRVIGVDGVRAARLLVYGRASARNGTKSDTCTKRGKITADNREKLFFLFFWGFFSYHLEQL